jgi:hypothetical protein
MKSKGNVAQARSTASRWGHGDKGKGWKMKDESLLGISAFISIFAIFAPLIFDF